MTSVAHGNGDERLRPGLKRQRGEQHCPGVWAADACDNARFAHEPQDLNSAWVLLQAGLDLHYYFAARNPER